ncbi:MAG: methyl-accepting chemotaxis protein [Gammaproteobacteria bacterium]
MGEGMVRLLRRLQLRTSVMLCVIAVNLLSSGVFALYVYRVHRDDLRAGLDRQLVTTAQALKLSADEVHDRLAREGSVDAAGYRALLRRQAAFARAAGVAYAYTMIERDGALQFTSDSPSDEDFADESYAKLFEVYADASPGLLDAVRTQRQRFDEYTDKWGSFRSVFVPTRTAAGNAYVIGVDVDIAHVRGALRATLWKALAIGAVLLVMSCALTWLSCGVVFRPLKILVARVDAIAAGDLRSAVAIEGEHEIAQFGRQIDTMSAALREMIGHVQASATGLRQTAHALSEQAADSQRRADGQAVYIEQASRAALGIRQDMDRALDEVARTRVAAEEAVASSGIGREVVARAGHNVESAQIQSDAVAESIARLNVRVDDIQHIIHAIGEIAAQTNLLALNAAIEAARAGEQGRGFAVVADEVRSLAAKTLGATNQIEQTIGAVLAESDRTTRTVAAGNEEARAASACMAEVDAALEIIADSSRRVRGEFEKIVALSERQAGTTLEIADTLDKSKALSADTASTVRALAVEADKLVALAETLTASTDRFRIAA